MTEFALFCAGALLFLLIPSVMVLAVTLRRAFVRLDEADRATESLRRRIAELEKAPVAPRRESQPVRPAAPPEPVAAPALVVPPSPIPPHSDLPPKGGTYRTESEVAENHETESESLETQIGSRWLLYIGIVAIVIGVAYFEKLAIEKEWLGETARVIQGGVIGLVLTFVGLRFVRAGYDTYGQIITGGGAAVLYLSTYAAFNFYHLIERPLAFTLMVGITVMVAWLADRLRSQGLALFGVGGGFVTPFLLPGTTDAQIALFGYDTILIGGTMVLSHRRSWPALNIVSYVLTVVTVAGWADRFYTPEKYLRTELFVTLFCAMFLYILRQIRTSNADSGAEASRLVLASAPIAYYIASLVFLSDHSTALLVWLVALMLIGGILSERAGTAAGLAVWVAVTLPLLLWTVTHRTPAWQASGLSTIAAVYLIALAAQLRRTFIDGAAELGVADIFWLHLNGLLMFAAAYILISATNVAITANLAAVFALCQGLLAAIVLKRQRNQALHFGALAFTLLSIAIALQWDGPAVAIGWAAEGAVIVALGLHERRDWMRIAGVGLFAVAFGLAMSLLTTERAVSEAVFFNPHAAAAAAIAALSYVLAWLHYRDPAAPDRTLAIGLALIVAQVATLALLTSEIHAYWSLREGSFARQMMVSVTWGVYATALIVIGLWRGYAPIRYFAIALFAITIVKVFAFDMAQLDRVYRISSIIVLGLTLLVTSYLYQRASRRS
jgi:uncharacterized membrane protein